MSDKEEPPVVKRMSLNEYRDYMNRYNLRLVEVDVRPGMKIIVYVEKKEEIPLDKI